MLLAQLTDSHIKPGGRLAYGRVDTAKFLGLLVDHVNSFSPAIDAVIVTGDLVDTGRQDEYDAIAPILGRLTMPYYVVPGNHDNPQILRTAFSGQGYLEDCGRYIQYAIDRFPVRLIGLDTSVPGEIHGQLCKERLDWLDKTLGQEPNKPTFLFMHHPPFATGINHMDVQNLKNPDDLFNVLDGHKQVHHIACGHVHRAVETTVRGIGVSIAPGAAHSVTLDFDPQGSATFMMEPPAVKLFRFGGDLQCAAHLSFAGDFPGPYLFKEDPAAS